MVSYNVTFQHLSKKLKNVDLSVFSAEDELEFGLGSIYPMPSGLTKNIELYIGFDKIVSPIEGHSFVYNYLSCYGSRIKEKHNIPFLVDALGCDGGCNYGSATETGTLHRDDLLFATHALKEAAYHCERVPKAFNNKERFIKLNEAFNELDINDFMREYNSNACVRDTPLSDAVIEEVFYSMMKFTEEDRHKDCGNCGYKSCYEMAQAIAYGINITHNCIHYAQACIEQENQQVNSLMEEISGMNDELRASAQMKSDFLANMSHEIRTPMNAVIGMAEMALRGELPNEERGYIEQIKSSGRSLLTIINDILDFSKIESGKMEITEAAYDITSVINDTAGIIMSRIGEKDIVFLMDVDPNIPRRLFGDDIRIKQVLLNIANNAVKFTEKGSVTITVSFSAIKDGIMLNFAVKDTGIGIKEDDMSKLFNSFQQVDSKRNRNIEGTGLGLAISQRLVTLMGGNIGVQSIYGSGSTFSFSVPQKVIESGPCADVHTVKEQYCAYLLEHGALRNSFKKILAMLDIKGLDCMDAASFREAVCSGVDYAVVGYRKYSEGIKEFLEEYDNVTGIVIVDANKFNLHSSKIRELKMPIYFLNAMQVFDRTESVFVSAKDEESKIKSFEAPDAKVLIVDDNQINLTVAVGLLKPMKMQISTAVSAKQAIQMISSIDYDLVFMDHMMPEMDGVEATKIIRAMQGDYFKNLPILALSANAVREAREMFISEGMNDFVSKPIEISDITAKLLKWLPKDKIKAVSASEPSPVADESIEINGLDTQAGIQLSGSKELYLKILSDYYVAIEKKAALIKKYYEEKNYSAYTIEVHALKSASKLIGASKLSVLAAELEKSGKSGDINDIAARTPELLKMYLDYLPILKPFAPEEVSDADKHTASAEDVKNVLATLSAALEDFDIDTAETCKKELSSYLLDEISAKYLEDISEMIDNIDYDGAQTIVKDWLDNLSAE